MKNDVKNDAAMDFFRFGANEKKFALHLFLAE